MSDRDGLRSQPKRVFISYSHDSPEHVERVLMLANRLRADGVDARLDLYETAPPQGWPRWALDEVDVASFVLVVTSEIYYTSFRGRGSAAPEAAWQGGILTQEIFDLGCNTRFVPITFGGSRQWIPEPLRAFPSYDLEQPSVYDHLFRHLTSQPEHPKPALGRLRLAEPLPVLAVEQTQFGRSHDAFDKGPLEEGLAALRPGKRRNFLGLVLGVLGIAITLHVLNSVLDFPGKWQVWRSSTMAQTGSQQVNLQVLRGEVLDDSTGLPLVGALVELREYEHSMETTQGGRFIFSLPAAKDSRVRVRVSMDGYVTKNEDPTLGAGQIEVYRLTRQSP